MQNDIISPNRGSRGSRTASYRPDTRAMYAPRVMRSEVQPRTVRPVASTKPMMQDVVMVAKPAPQPTEMDEVFTHIAEAEYEAPIVAADTFAAAGDAMAITPAVIAHPFPHNAEAPAPVRDDTPVAPRRKFHIRHTATIVLAVLIIGLTGYVSIDTWLTNNQVRQATGQTPGSASAGGVTLGEGQDETEVTENAVDSYQVAGDLPRVVNIEKLGVRARVLPMSVNADNSLQAPVNIYDTGWYTASAKPGQIGAALIDAHASGATRAGVFAYVDTLKIGDQMTVENGNGEVFTYRVTHKETVALDDVDMSKLLLPYGTATEGVNLITCTGEWVEEKKTFDHRVLVYTERVL